MKDLAIIGGGPAGYVAAERAASAGMSVVLFERRELGGVCLNEGCIPTKTLLYGAKVHDTALHGDKYGVSTSGVGFDYAKMAMRKNKVVRKLVAGIGLKMKSHGVEVVKGRAEITGRSGSNIVIACEGQEFTASNLLIATGSEAFIPHIDGVSDNPAVLTNREILALKELPVSIVIVGGGVIGMEFASLYNSLGCEVTVIEMMPEILGNMDYELSAMLREIYAKRGVQFHLECRVNKIEGGTVRFVTSKDTEHSMSAERILVSVGRRPVTEGFGLEKLGLEMYGKGVKVDSRMRTSVPGVFAAGDVTGYSMLAHTASREAEVVVNNLTGRDDVMSYDAIPSVVYTNPEVASVGLTAKDAADMKIAYSELTLPMAYSGRFVAENEGVNGLCKVIVGERGEILGVQMLGNPASEMVFGAAMAIEKGMTVDELKRVVFPHPTVSEIIKETIYEFKQ